MKQFTDTSNSAIANKWHEGVCHCGAVKFRFFGNISRAVFCNCSYCVRKSAMHFRVSATSFELMHGIDNLNRYQFGTRRAIHFFCRICGIHTHCHPRSAPEKVNINLHCVEADQRQDIEISYFEGRAWDF